MLTPTRYRHGRILVRALATMAVVALPLLAWAQVQAKAPQQPAALDRWLGRLNRPFIIGIAGDSGSGKSTFARNLTATLGADRVKTICVDDYHKLDRQGRKAHGVTALNFAANDLGRLARDLGRLRQGKSIMKPVYDHGDGTLKGPEPFAPAPIIIVEGLHPFATKSLRQQVDLAVYFDPNSSVKNSWKIQRDVEQRGHSREAVLKSIRQRKPDYTRFVQPQRDQADVLVQFGWSKLNGTDGLRVQLRQRNQRPSAKRLRVNRSGPSYVLRGERRRDGSSVATIDGPVPAKALGNISHWVQHATGARPELDRRSPSLDAARVIVASRVIREIVRASRPGLRSAGVRAAAAR